MALNHNDSQVESPVNIELSDSTLTIESISLGCGVEYNELSAVVDGEKVYLRLPASERLHCSAEFFVGIALLEAMFSRRKLVVSGDVPISTRLTENIGALQSVYACWNRGLDVVSLTSKTSSALPYEPNRVGAFFSGGVDSTHTLMRHRGDISHLLMFNCFDDVNGIAQWQESVAAATEFARKLDKTLLPVETNARQWIDKRRISWEFAHGMVLCSVGSALGMSRVYIPSSHSYDQLFPWGTHPLTDPMWSTESCEIVHDGAASSRGEKIRDLIEGEFADNLQVCWRSTGGNCGECSKCTRTMVAVHLLGGHVNTLPAFGGRATLKRMRATDEGLASQLEDTMRLAAEVGDEEIYRALFRLYRRYRLAAMLADLDRLLLGSALKRLYRHFRRPQWLNARVTLVGDRTLESRL